MTLFNGDSQPTSNVVRVPISSSRIINVADPNGTSIPYVVCSSFECEIWHILNKIIPTFIPPNQLSSDNNSIAPYELCFVGTVKPLGFSTYFITDQIIADRHTAENEYNLKKLILFHFLKLYRRKNENEPLHRAASTTIRNNVRLSINIESKQ